MALNGLHERVAWGTCRAHWITGQNLSVNRSVIRTLHP